jgi:hypothetical protein
MVGNEMFEIAEKLKNVMETHKSKAKSALEDLPEGETKNKLNNLMSAAVKGDLKYEDAQRELQKIINNAG